MKTCAGMLVLLCMAFAGQATVEGAEYFVNKQGSDTNPGTSQTAALLTIQKGVNALKPGDTLTIGPGEYSENVFRLGLGNAEKETVIRAEIPGTVLLRGDVPAPEFEKVEGYRFVYAAAFDGAPEAVLEHATMTILEKKPALAELEFEPGASFYDAEAKMLYISSADQQPPGDRRYTVVITPRSGLYLELPQRVVIEGISATGYYCTMVRRVARWVEDYQWGIVLERPTSCTIRDCYTFLNCGGIALDNGRGNVVEGCVAHDNTNGNIQFYGGENNADNVVRHCRAFRGGTGVDYYTTFSGPVRIENCISWGNYLDYSTKGGNSAEFAFMESSVALGNIRIHNLKNCVLGGRDNEYKRGIAYTRDNVVFTEEKDLDVDHEFADPINMDFRLQGGSRFVGTGEDGTDRGLYPDHDYVIYFLSPEGNDENDGTSVRRAWKTLDRALKELKPGDTLYLSEGVYEMGIATLGRPGGETIHIRGRGRDRIVIQGAPLVADSAGVTFDRVSFAGFVGVVDSETIEFANCEFHGLNVDTTKGLKITHGLFIDTALILTDATGVYLSGNIYAAYTGIPTVAMAGENEIHYSDYNSYQDANHCWGTEGETKSLSDLHERGYDRYSQILKPEFVEAGGPPQLANADVFAGRGPHGTDLGRYQEYEEEKPSIVGPFLHSVSDTTANIEWWTSAPATCEVAWGEASNADHLAKSVNLYRFFSFSLTGLKPGTEYQFNIRSVQLASKEATPLPPFKPEREVILTFTTAATAHKPATYYVATDGDDANTGLSRNKAWRTIGYASAQVNAGDTVMIAGGTYQEMVRLRASGAPKKPITFRPIPGERVVMDGEGRSLSQAIIINEKKHVNVDGIYFTYFSGPAIVVLNSENVRVTRCFSDGRGPGYAGPLLHAQHCTNFTARNCVSISGMGSGMFILDCPDTLIENNVFLRNLIYGCVLVNEPDDRIIMRKNVFADSLPFKSQVQYLEIGKIESLAESDNCYYMRLPDEERKMFLFYGDGDYERGVRGHGMKTVFDKPSVIPKLVRIGLGEFKKIKGETGSYLGNPGFAGSVGMREDETMTDQGREYPVLLSDKLVGKRDLDFPDLFATDPKAVDKSIGLVPEDFEDFGFEEKQVTAEGG